MKLSILENGVTTPLSKEASPIELEMTCEYGYPLLRVKHRTAGNLLQLSNRGICRLAWVNKDLGFPLLEGHYKIRETGAA